METQFAETTERVQEAMKQTSELFTKTTASLMDAYSKQMNTGYEFYKKLSETALNTGETKWSDIFKENSASYQKAVDSTMNLSKEIMEKMLSAFTESEFSPLSKKSMDVILDIFTKQAQQSVDFGKQFLHSLKIEDVLSSESFKKQSARFNELMRENIQSSESAIKEMIASYNEQASFTQESTQKLMNSIRQRIESVTKANAKFTEELMQTLKAKGTSEKHTIVPSKHTGKKAK